MMMKQMLVAPMLGLALLAQAPAAQPRQMPADDLLAEVRALRAEIREMAESSLRAQLLVARLQVQEQRIAGIARQLSDTEERMRAMEGARNPFLTQMLKNFEQAPGDPDQADLFAGVKAQLEKIENGDPVLKERQASLSKLLAEEQARWVGFNTQLEELERQAARKR